MTPSLIGNSDSKVDAKGRAFLPASFRRLLGDEKVFYLRKGLFENCLVLYPETAWESTISELRQQLNPWVREEDMIFRQFVADVEIITLDSSGRFLIPKRYLKLASIEQEVRFIGMDSTIEIWAKETTEKPFMDPEEFEKELAEIMGIPDNK